ncbi:MAG: hypothetical protein IJY18_06235 [Clostridia bacterium]|nr:hypothetical protein [Clostridia bacterium]
MKKKYEKVSLEIVSLNETDIITTSDTTGGENKGPSNAIDGTGDPNGWTEL